jgi:hypothetical protein
MRLLLSAAVLFFSSAAHAELRKLCPDRPGKATPACTLDPGNVEFETSAVDWTRDTAGNGREDSVLLGDSLLRIGLTANAEAQIGWTPWGHVRSRDASGITDTMSGTGDVTLSIRHNLRNPDGSGTSIALQPFVSLATGGKAIGAGDWGAGLTIPISFTLPHSLQLGIAPTLEAAVDADGTGRHLAYEIATALTAPWGDSGLSTSIELWSQRDDDPSGHSSQYSVDLAGIWQPNTLSNVQLDLGVNLGLNRNTPDLELISGFAVRF